MKTEIYYFTGTGNTLAIAKELAKKIKGTKLIPMAKVVRKKIEITADNFGIVFPVYAWGAPLMVVDFLNKLKIKKSNYNFAVTNFAGTPGATLSQIAKLLKKKGHKLSAGFAIKMPGNYIPMYDPAKLYNNSKLNNLYNTMKQRINSIAGYVNQQKKYKIEKSNFLINLLTSGFLYKISMPHFADMDRKFWVNEDCNSCKICYKVCPSNNIKMVNKLPEWQHKCEQCFACLHWCPKQAIQYGQKSETKSRYHHPDVKVKELFVN